MNNEILHDYLNLHNERIQKCGDIILNLDYWDCECDDNYIHPIAIQVCNRCSAHQDENPSSREAEVHKRD